MALRPRRGMFELPEDVVPTAVKPAPAPQQTGPVGMPSSDSVKTQSGETAPFDPNAQAPVPAVAQTSAPASSGMGINIDLDIPDIPSDINETLAENMYGQYGDRLFPYVYTARNDDLNTGQSRGPLDGLSIEMLSAQDLYTRFRQDNYAQRAFGSFENYIGYLDDLLNLAEEHPEINWWKDKAFRNLTAGTVATAEFYGLDPEDARSGSGALIDATSANMQAANDAFEAMLALPEFRQLVADRGIETQFRLSENDIYAFNGLTATEIHEGADTFGAYFEAAMDLANRLTLAYMTGQVGNAGLSSLRDAAELGTLGPYSSSIGRVIDLMNYGQAGAGSEASAVLNEVGPVIVNLGDDTQVEDPLAEAEEEPTEDLSVIDPLLTGDPGDLFEPETPIEETPFEFEVIEPEEQEEPEPDLPIEIEPPILPEPEEDIFTDTVQEATGFEESVVRDLLDEYIQPVLTSLEDQDEETAGIQTAIGTITEQQQETLQEFVRQGGQIEELDSNQQQIIEDLGGVNQVVGDLAENVSGLEEGLQQAATEREDIRASQEELAAGLTEAQQERYDLAQDLIQVGGLVENLDAASQERFDELDITVDSLAEEFGVDFDRLEQGLLSAEEATDALQEYAEEEFGAVREDIAGLEEQIDANAAQQLAELTGIRSEFLETLSASEAAAIARNQGLSDQLTEQITGVRGETAAQIEGINERLTDRISAYEQQTGEQLDIAAEERAELGGQLGTLTEEVANIATDLINVGGDIENLDQRTQDRLDELGLGLQDLGLLVNVNFEALQQGMLTQESAMQELIEETTRQTEESLTERLEQAEEGFATSLSDTEANLLSQITGVEAGVLQQLAEVEGGLQSQFGEQFGQVQEQVAGLGEQVAGVGEGLGQLGQALGTGLLGLAAAQPTAQQIAAAMPRQPVEFDPFLKGLSPFQPLTPIALAPQKQTDAMSELNKFIGRQTGMLV